MIILLPMLFILLLVLGNTTINPLPSSFFRILFNIFAPLIAFFFYFLVGYKFLNVNLQSQESKERLGFVITLSIIGLFFAITMNTRNFLLISSLYGLGFITQETAIYLAFSILTPLVEEFVKIYPALIMSKHVRIDANSRSRYITNPRDFLFYALIGGAIFNLIETYWYSWSVGSFDEISNPDNWAFIALQIVIRSSNPLHIVTAMIAGLGIIVSLQISSEPMFSGRNWSPFLSYFVASIVIHGIWNASALQAENVATFLELPILNWILLFLMIGGFLFLLLNYGNSYIPTCELCNNWHDTGVQHVNEELLIPNLIFGENQISYRCPNCDEPKPGQKCSNCAATEVFACSNCEYPLPIYAFECWKCGNPITPIYDELTSVKPSSINQFSSRFYALFAFMYAGQLLLLLSNTSRSNLSSDLPNQLILNTVISSALIVGLYLNIKPKFRQWGILISKYLFGLIILLLAVLFHILVIVFVSSYLFGSAILLFLFSLIYIFVGYRLLNIKPIYVRTSL